jgi:hypothetical protein
MNLLSKLGNVLFWLVSPIIIAFILLASIISELAEKGGKA